MSQPFDEEGALVVRTIENNLSLANMDFEEFARAAGPGGGELHCADAARLLTGP